MSEGFAALRDRAKTGVVEPLLQMGMRKPKGVSAEDHDAMLDRLAEKLAYLDPKWHGALVETIAGSAVSGRARVKGRPPRDVWPSEVAIVNWARAMAKAGGEPDLVTRLAGTWMASADGREALARSPFEAWALFCRLQRGTPPTADGARAMILEHAAKLQAQVVGIEREVASMQATPEQRVWLDGWYRRVAWLERLVAGEIAPETRVAA